MNLFSIVEILIYLALAIFGLQWFWEYLDSGKIGPWRVRTEMADLRKEIKIFKK